LLNHISGSQSNISGFYNHHEYLAEKRNALELWARRFERIAQPRL
jgi:hypothetical protein